MLDGRIAPTAGSVSTLNTDLSILSGGPSRAPDRFLIRIADDAGALAAYHLLRHREFVERQGLFPRTDVDDVDRDDRTVVLTAVTAEGTVIGGVRVAPVTAEDIGWWSGSRLVVAEGAHAAGVGAALIRAACAHVEANDVLRFDAHVQSRYARLFIGLGWDEVGAGDVIAGRAHRRMTWPIGRIGALVAGTKAMLADVLAPLSQQIGGLGPAGFRGDDGVPVPQTDVFAACDAILPAMVERDPEWAGWSAVLVNMNDLSAMGAHPLGMLDAVSAPTTSHLTRVVRGIASAAHAWRTPVLGGHTQVGAHASLSITAFGRTSTPVVAGGGKVGDTVSLIADLGGGWRPGYHGRQWDSTSSRTADEIATMSALLGRIGPAAGKDVSMAGIVGTLGMLAEASGTGAELEVAAVPRPADAAVGAWLTCFPGFAMLAADRSAVTDVAGPVVAAGCGRLTADEGVRLRWPDGAVTSAVATTVTGLGRA